MSTSFRATVDDFSLHGGDRSLHYERDHDLYVQSKGIQGGGDVAAMLLIELGIDGNATHRARLDFGVVGLDDDAFRYAHSGDEVKALADAIEVLTALHDRLAQMHALD